MRPLSSVPKKRKREKRKMGTRHNKENEVREKLLQFKKINVAKKKKIN